MGAADLRRALAGSGLDLWGTLDAATHDAVAPPVWRVARVSPAARSVVILGNAGRGLWDRLRDAPEWGEPHPVDRYTARVVAEAMDRHTPDGRAILYPEHRGGVYLPLVPLAERAGLGRPGRIGLLLHPRYGPWISLRAALFLAESLPESEPIAAEPCEGCAAPCRGACPAGAVGDGLDPRVCLRSRVWRCRSRCNARSACVLGPEHAFSEEQVALHMRIRPSPSWLRHAVPALLRRPPPGS